jgi:hypothetical protein
MITCTSVLYTSTHEKRQPIDNNNVTKQIKIMTEILKFDTWMFKIQNKYYFDHERMDAAYNRIAYKINE